MLSTALERRRARRVAFTLVPVHLALRQRQHARLTQPLKVGHDRVAQLLKRHVLGQHRRIRVGRQAHGLVRPATVPGFDAPGAVRGSGSVSKEIPWRQQKTESAGRSDG